MTTPPPAPATQADKRRHARIELFAQVQVSQQSECYIMSTANLSRGGLFISGDPREYPDLIRGATVDLCIFAEQELGAPDAHLRARVVRVVEKGNGFSPGFGLEFLNAPMDQTRALLDLLLAAGGH
jgi:hypothetical protein